MTIREGGAGTKPESGGPRPRRASAPDPMRTLRSCAERWRDPRSSLRDGPGDPSCLDNS